MIDNFQPFLGFQTKCVCVCGVCVCYLPALSPVLSVFMIRACALSASIVWPAAAAAAAAVAAAAAAAAAERREAERRSERRGAASP